MKSILLSLMASIMVVSGSTAFASEQCEKINSVYKTLRRFDIADMKHRNVDLQQCIQDYCDHAKGTLTSGIYLFTSPSHDVFHFRDSKTVQNCKIDVSDPDYVILSTSEISINTVSLERLDVRCHPTLMIEDLLKTCEVVYEQ